jgi:outer membrane protein assembly factor BamB
MPTGTPSATGPSSSRPGYAAYPSSVTIDLGTDREPDADADPPLRISRPVKAALLVLLSLFALTGAAAARPGLTEVASLGETPAAAFALSTDAAFIAAYGDGVNTSIVRRYGLHLADGTPDWTTGLPQTVDNVTVAERAGVVLAGSYSGQGVTALDANTGHVLWKEPVTYLLDVVDDTVLLTVQDDDGPSTLRLAELRSGSTVWTRTTRDNTAYWQLDVGLAPPRPATRIVVVQMDGHATTLNLADGHVLADADLGFRLHMQEQNYAQDFTEVTVADGALYVGQRVDGRTSLTSFGLDTLTQIWRTTDGLPGGLTDCGTVICVSDGTTLAAIHPATGRQLWTQPRWQYGYALGSGALLASHSGSEQEATLLDPATGRPLRELGPVAAIYGRSGLFLRTDSDVPTVRLITVGPDDGAVRLIGDVGAVTPYRCSAAGDYVGCPTVAGPTKIWRLPR